MLQRLRAVASDVGCASFELEDDNGTLSIVLDFPSLDLDKAKNAARRFAELADFDRAHVGRLD
jgi:hypothetical protein